MSVSKDYLENIISMRKSIFVDINNLIAKIIKKTDNTLITFGEMIVAPGITITSLNSNLYITSRNLFGELSTITNIDVLIAILRELEVIQEGIDLIESVKNRNKPKEEYKYIKYNGGYDDMDIYGYPRLERFERYNFERDMPSKFDDDCDRLFDGTYVNLENDIRGNHSRDKVSQMLEDIRDYDIKLLSGTEVENLILFIQSIDEDLQMQYLFHLKEECNVDREMLESIQMTTILDCCRELVFKMRLY